MKTENSTKTEPICEIPEPPQEWSSETAMLYWKICQLLLNRGKLNHLTAAYARNISADLTAARDPEFFQVWKHGKAGHWIMMMAETVGISLDRIEEIERDSFRNINADFAERIGLTLEEIENL